MNTKKPTVSAVIPLLFYNAFDVANIYIDFELPNKKETFFLNVLKEMEKENESLRKLVEKFDLTPV